MRGEPNHGAVDGRNDSTLRRVDDVRDRFQSRSPPNRIIKSYRTAHPNPTSQSLRCNTPPRIKLNAALQTYMNITRGGGSRLADQSQKIVKDENISIPRCGPVSRIGPEIVETQIGQRSSFIAHQQNIIHAQSVKKLPPSENRNLRALRSKSDASSPRIQQNGVQRSISRHQKLPAIRSLDIVAAVALLDMRVKRPQESQPRLANEGTSASENVRLPEPTTSM